MTREDVYAEMTQMMGSVPTFFKSVPDASIATEWALFKQIQMDEGQIPHKYRELIGVGIAAVTHCKYCIYFHTEMAKLFGATDAEVTEAVHYAKSSAGWSTFINGSQTDFAQFKAEVDSACNHVRNSQAQQA